MDFFFAGLRNFHPHARIFRSQSRPGAWMDFFSQAGEKSLLMLVFFAPAGWPGSWQDFLFRALPETIHS